MTVCRAELSRGERVEWATPKFWERLDRVAPHPDPHDPEGRRLVANVTGPLAESGICKIIWQQILNHRQKNAHAYDSELPLGAAIKTMVASIEPDPHTGELMERITAVYPVIANGEPTFARYTTDLTDLAQPEVLTDTLQVHVIQRLGKKLHIKATEYNLTPSQS